MMSDQDLSDFVAACVAGNATVQSAVATVAELRAARAALAEQTAHAEDMQSQYAIAKAALVMQQGLDAEAQSPPWRKIDGPETLPEDNEDVLWQLRKAPDQPWEVPTVGPMDEWKREVYAEGVWRPLERFSHWMPLPAPPDEKSAPCGFVPPMPGYAPCTRDEGHEGPCAHPLAADAPDACPYGCKATPLFGLTKAHDPAYFGGVVDAHGFRHDPVKHAADCPWITGASQSLAAPATPGKGGGT